MKKFQRITKKKAMQLPESDVLFFDRRKNRFPYKNLYKKSPSQALALYRQLLIDREKLEPNHLEGYRGKHIYSNVAISKRCYIDVIIEQANK